jgi:phosphoribosylglycinamide formyltransferase-1
MARVKVGVLISGRGSNLKALIEAARDPAYPAEIAHVISNRPDAPGLDYAEDHGIPTEVIDHTRFAGRPGFEAALTASLTSAGVELVCLAGFMRVLTAEFVDQWANRILNIHPSLLPAFPGTDTHRQALAAGVTITGCTVHLVSEAVDGGPIVGQAAVPVQPGDTPDSLGARVLAAEHRLYPHCLAEMAAGKVRVIGHGVEIADRTVPDGVLYNPGV